MYFLFFLYLLAMDGSLGHEISLHKPSRSGLAKKSPLYICVVVR